MCATKQKIHSPAWRKTKRENENLFFLCARRLSRSTTAYLKPFCEKISVIECRKHSDQRLALTSSQPTRGSSRFSGLTSRWTMLRRCKKVRASRICRIICEKDSERIRGKLPSLTAKFTRSTWRADSQMLHFVGEDMDEICTIFRDR